jgi:hypothetical protein
MTISPSATQSGIAYKPIQFTAARGSGAFTWSVSTNNSGGSITSNGLYTPGKTGNVDDVVQVTDGFTTLNVTVHVWSPANLGAAVTRWYYENAVLGTWTDERANKNFLQAVGGNQASVSNINGHPAFLFVGAHPDFFDGDSINATDVTTAFTVWCVINATALPTAAGVGASLLTHSYAQLAFWLGADWTANSGKVTLGRAITTAGKFARSDAALNDSALHRIIGTFDGTTYTLYVDGVAQATTGTDATNVPNSVDTYRCGFAGAGAGALSGKLGNEGLNNTALAGPIGDSTSNLGKLDLFLKAWSLGT